MKRSWSLLLVMAVSCVILDGLSGVEKNAIFYFNQGEAFMERGEYRQALHAYKASLMKNPGYARAVAGLADVYVEMGGYGEALELYKKYERIEGRKPHIVIGLARIHRAMGHYSTALKLLQEVLKDKPEEIDGRYEMAHLYFIMGKKVWARRQIDAVFRLNPFHYKTLLLQAEMKRHEKRFAEARAIMDRAIDSNPQNYKGYVLLAEIHYSHYYATDDTDSLAEAEYALKNALAMRPHDYRANKLKGVLLFDRKLYNESSTFFRSAMKEYENAQSGYNVAVSSSFAGDSEGAMKGFLTAYRENPLDSVVRTSLEDFLVLGSVKIGHPARILLYKELARLAGNREKHHLPTDTVYYLRRSLMLNPMDRASREKLLEYYSVLDYNRFYINEIKELMKLFPGTGYGDKLKVAVLRRRKKLYYRHGLFPDPPVRSVPVVRVLNFTRENAIPGYINLGNVLASNLTFVLQQFGRMEVTGLRERERSAGRWHHLKTPGEQIQALEKSLEAGEVKKADYAVYGTCGVKGATIVLTCNLYDMKRGMVIDSFTLTEKKRERVPRLAMRSAHRIFDSIPFHGNVIKTDEEGLLVNIGLYDEVTSGSKLMMRKKIETASGEDVRYKTIIFTVEEADTLVSYIKPENKDDLNDITGKEDVYPLKTRRAKKLK